jgi:hypothetical protein
MMLSTKARRRIRNAAVLTLLAGGLLYALRWPLLGRAIAGAVRKKAVAALAADLRIGRLSGSIVSSVQATGVELLPRPGSALRAGRLDRLEVRYGFLGLSGLHVAAHGLRIELAPSTKPPAPPHETIREALRALEELKLPSEIQVEQVTVVTADGTEFVVERARWKDEALTALLRTQGWGSFDVDLKRGPGHELLLRGRAPQAPVSEASFEIDGGQGPEHPARLRASTGRETVRWDGTVSFGSDGRPTRVDGSLVVREGRASTRLDLTSGETDLAWDARLSLDKDIQADVLGKGRIHGSLAEPLDRWTVSEGFLKVSSATVRGCLLSGELTFDEGTLGRLPWRGHVGCGDDRAVARGLVSWKTGFGLEAELTLDARSLDPYRGLLPEGLKADASSIHLEGHAEVGAAGPSFEGTLRVGKGAVAGTMWDSVRCRARVTPSEAVVRELAIEGVPAAPSISLSGMLRASPGYRTVDVDVAGPKIVLGPPVASVLTDLVVRGRLDERGVELYTLDGRLDHGPFRAIGRWDFRTERKEARGHLVGENVLVLSDKLGRVRVSPDVWVSGSAEAGWKVDGSAELPSLVFYGELGDPQASRQGPVKAAAAPKLRLAPAPGGGFLIPSGLAGGERIALDLELRTTREARVENSALGALVRADLRLGGTLAAPSISGALAAHRGEVKLATGVFLRIERLDVTLPQEEGHAGTIYFKGKSGKGAGAITVVISGPLDDPSLTLSSNPPRKQEELLATLAFGVAPGAVSGQDALGTLAVKVFEQATDAWPKAEPAESFWSRLSLSTADENAPDPEKRVPWQLPPTGSARGTIVRTEYLLNSFLSVVAESDREANVSGDLKVRFHFR